MADAPKKYATVQATRARIKMEIATGGSVSGRLTFEHDDVVAAEKYYREVWLPATHQIPATHPLLTAQKDPVTSALVSPLPGNVIPWENGNPVHEKAKTIQLAMAEAQQRAAAKTT